MAETLEEQVGKLLRQQEMILVLAESCTGGLVSHRITNVPGSSDYYLGGITAYANQAKERLLGVQHATLLRFGAVSRETALEMARGIRSLLAGDFPLERTIGVSITGIAGPAGGTPEKPVGLVWFALSAPEGEWAWQHVWNGSRVEIKEQSAQRALELLLEYLTDRLKNSA